MPITAPAITINTIKLTSTIPPMSPGLIATMYIVGMSKEQAIPKKSPPYAKLYTIFAK